MRARERTVREDGLFRVARGGGGRGEGNKPRDEVDGFPFLLMPRVRRPGSGETGPDGRELCRFGRDAMRGKSSCSLG